MYSSYPFDLISLTLRWENILVFKHPTTPVLLFLTHIMLYNILSELLFRNLFETCWMCCLLSSVLKLYNCQLIVVLIISNDSFWCFTPLNKSRLCYEILFHFLSHFLNSVSRLSSLASHFNTSKLLAARNLYSP